MNNYAKIYNPEEGFDSFLSVITAKKIINTYNIVNCEILDIGSGTGIIAEFFHKNNNISIVEQHDNYVSILRNKFEPKNIFNQNFMSSEIIGLFDFIFIFNNIQEQENIKAYLQKASKNLKPGGSILITYPNALSIHRLIASGIGIIKDPLLEKSNNSKKYGDFHLLTEQKLREIVSSLGLNIKKEEGIFFKPFTNDELEKLDSNTLNIFNSLSHIYPKNCALNFVEVSK